MKNSLKKILLVLITILTLTSCSGGGSGGIGAALGIDIVVVDGYIRDAHVIDSNGNIAKYKSKGIYTFTPAPTGEITVTGGYFEDSNLPNTMTFKVSSTSRVISPITSFLYKYPHLKENLLTALGIDSVELLGDFVKSNQINIAKLAQIIYSMNVNVLEDDFATSITNPTNLNDIFDKAMIVVTNNNPTRIAEIKIFLNAVKDYTGDASNLELKISKEKAENANPTKLPLIELENFEYVGAFIIPGSDYGESNANYANGKIEYNPTNNSLYIIGHAHQQAIAEFEIPELVNSLDLHELNTAPAPLQNFTKILDKTSNPQNIDRVTGMKLFGNQLMINGLEYYDAPADNRDTTIMIRDVSNISTSEVDGYYELAGRAHGAGWISPIPAEWQELLGGPYISGNASNLPIASRQSIGPTAFIFDPTLLLNNFTTKNIPATALIDFSLKNPLHDDQYNNDRDNDLWTVVSQAQYGFIVPNTRTYITIGSSGGHEFGLGYKATQDTGRLCGGPCSLVAADNYNYYWLWDVNDMVAVKNGEKLPHEVRPYKYGKFSLPFQTDVRNNNSKEMHAISGATFDNESGILYITIGKADSRGKYSNNPIIAAYKFKNHIDVKDNSGNDDNSTQIYDVTTTSSVGGTITPSSVDGDNTSFIITVDNNYTISSVSGCGGSLSGNIYTTGVITGNCIINVVFNSSAPAEAKSFMQAIADGDAEPIIINGKEWTFRTPPPPENERTVRDTHPRLLLTSDNLPEIRIKLQDPVYDSYMRNIISRADAGNMFENAFLYQLNADITRGNVAKDALLNYSGDYGERIIYGYDSMSDKYGPILVFDWIMDILSEAEKVQIFANVKDNFNYDHKTADSVNHDGNGAGTYPWYWNDVYNRHPEIYLPALAFAIHDEGIDDSWANEVIEWAYDEDETRVVGPYGPNRGSGFLDVLMTISLDTGGVSDTNQYYAYWSEVLHAISFWESATGQEMWSRIPFMMKSPQSLLTSRDGIHPSSRIMSVIEFITGIGDGDTAALAKYTTEYYGASEYHVVHRAILGDMRVQAKTPTELNIPTAKYIRGDHVFYSKSSWEDDAVSLYVRSPYINVGRGPGSAGVFGIDIGKREPLAPRVAAVSKTQELAGYSSGMWIYDPSNDKISAKSMPVQNLGTYWGWNDGRSYDAWTTVSKSGYFEGEPNSIDITDDYRAISMEYGSRYNKIEVNTAQRTIVHIPDTDRNFIVVYDYIDVPTNLKSAWQMRFMEEPTIRADEFSIAGKIKATVVAPQNHTLEWLGGINNEFVTPSPERLWYTNNKSGSTPGYSSQSQYLDKFGLGNIYIQPQGQKDNSIAPYIEQTEYLIVMEIGDQTPVLVTRISDREVRFGNWQILFNRDGTYIVTKL